MITKYNHVTKPYDKKIVLRALCMYSKWHFDSYKPSNPRTRLFKARYDYGTQFLIDLFVMTEVYMNHFPIFAMHKCRSDITYILNQTPDYRLKFEEKVITLTKGKEYIEDRLIELDVNIKE